MTDEAEHPAIVAGDRDRDASIELLSSAVAEGRLTLGLKSINRVS
jgi:hypothetical protein